MGNRKIIGLCLALLSSRAPALTMDEYLQEVNDNNFGVTSAKLSAISKRERRDEGKLFFRPSFFLTGEYIDDKRPTNAPFLLGNHTLRHVIRTGVSQNFRTGTKLTVGYNIAKTQVIGANSMFLTNPQFIDVSPQIELTQSLWRNFLGSETQAAEEAQKYQLDAQRFNDLYNYKLLLMNAQNAYWRFYFASLSLKVQRDSLFRARKIRDWNAKRVKANLAEESDLLQAQSNVQNREMEYHDTLTEYEIALREVNSFRQKDTIFKPPRSNEHLVTFILRSKLPKKAPMREDVKVFLANRMAAEANARAGTERNRPNLELFGTYSINGRDRDYHDAREQAETALRPYTAVGVRFTTPLDFESLSLYKQAYAKEVMAAQLSYKRKTYEVEREWEILNERFLNLKIKLRLSRKLAQMQDRKLKSEKARLDQGRTTTFNVLQFEQDFANAMLLKLRNERELIAIYNQMKLYTGIQE